jgi:hypothetical protein
MKLPVARFTVVAGLVASFASGGCDRSHSPAALVDAAISDAAPGDARGPDGGHTESHATDAGDGGLRAAADGGKDSDVDSGEPSGVPLTGLAAVELERCGIEPASGARTDPFELPHELKTLPYSHMEEACASGGFDLARCAGNTVEITYVDIDVVGGAPGLHYRAHVVTLDDSVCCTYVSAGPVTGGGLGPINCGPAYPARAAMERCYIGRHPREPKQMLEEVSVPAQLSEDPLWSARAKVCRKGDYDLTKCAGKQATLVSVVENAGFDGDGWLSAWVLTHGDDVCCIWETDSNKPSSLLARKCAPQE